MVLSENNHSSIILMVVNGILLNLSVLTTWEKNSVGFAFVFISSCILLSAHGYSDQPRSVLITSAK